MFDRRLFILIFEPHTCIDVHIPHRAEKWNRSPEFTKALKKMEERSDLQFLMAIEVKYSCFTHLNFEFVTRVCVKAERPHCDFFSLLHFHELVFMKFDVKKKRFSYAVRPFCLVTYNWSLHGQMVPLKRKKERKIAVWKCCLGCLKKFARELQNNYEKFLWVLHY